MKKIISLIREYVFPAGCGVCGHTLFDREEAFYGICADCRNDLSVDWENRCANCGRPLVSEKEICMQCRRQSNPSNLMGILPLFPYTGAFHQLLSAYKFKKRGNIGNFFAEKILEAAEKLKMKTPALTPVPPRAGKIKREGWDQIAFLSRILARRIPVRSCLKRLPSQAQKELNRLERQKNLLNRIRCISKPPQETALFDDVITTGATFEACATALKQAGCEKVYGICLFYAE